MKKAYGVPCSKINIVRETLEEGVNALGVDPTKAEIMGLLKYALGALRKMEDTKLHEIIATKELE